MEVRSISGIEDIDKLVELARAMYAESPIFSQTPFEDTVARGWFFRALETPDLVFCRLIEKDGALIGAMLAFCGAMIFSSVMMASDLGLYVYPEHRGTKAAYLLMKEFESWAKAQNCRYAVLGVTAGINNDAALGFYKKMGYSDLGKTVRKEFS